MDVTNEPNSTFGFESESDFDTLAGAVAALTADELCGLSESLSSTSPWDPQDTAHFGGGFLANQF